MEPVCSSYRWIYGISHGPSLSLKIFQQGLFQILKRFAISDIYIYVVIAIKNVFHDLYQKQASKKERKTAPESDYYMQYVVRKEARRDIEIS